MRVVVVTLAFAPARILLTMFDQVYKTIGLPKVDHFVLNNHYPVDQFRNDKLVENICQAYGAYLLDAGKNLGLSDGYNYLIEIAELQPGDVVIGLDPDVYPVTKGWGKALVGVVGAENNIGWATLMSEHNERELRERGYRPDKVGETAVWLANQACVNSVCAWKADMLKKLGGLTEPQKFYGGIESKMFPMIRNAGFEWAYLPHFREEYPESVRSEPVYREYKNAYAHDRSTQLEFSEWLKQRF